ncbi:MAG: GGDEF domain-containing protein [Deltaproteobacteria bacterium]|nr:GGDEF domain-containing protein [Deltaproteobacteria bacterium]
MQPQDRPVSDRLPGLLCVAVFGGDASEQAELAASVRATGAMPLELDLALQPGQAPDIDLLADALGRSGADAIVVSADGPVASVLAASRNISGRPAVLCRESAARPVGSCAWVLAEGGQDILERELEPHQLRRRLRHAVLRQRSVARWERLAERDALTGLLNRRGMHARLRSGQAMTAMLIDVDHFKQINDRHGHAVGDRVLRAVASAMATACRAGDTVARVGGDEMMVVVPGVDPVASRDLAIRLRDAVGAIAIPVGGAMIHVTVSIGAAPVPNDANDVSALMAACRAALSASKRRGRDRVTVDLGERPFALRAGSAPEGSDGPPQGE